LISSRRNSLGRYSLTISVVRRRGPHSVGFESDDALALATPDVKGKMFYIVKICQVGF